MIGAVVIGRNEGERLIRCLASVKGVESMVYVDSGSTDGSVDAAREAGADVVELDLSQPFTAARARNAGFERLMKIGKLTYVQFVDGDCEMQSDWFEAADSFLERNPKVAVVFGRVRERFPEVSIYNQLCDEEWNTPIGKSLYCGGIAMFRARALEAVGGFRDDLIAGEEPELCVRLGLKGWEIWRIDAEMTLHDAAMTRIGQWWTRARRSGHAAAEFAVLHGSRPERHGVRPTVRALGWGLFLPLVIVGAGVLVTPWAAALLLLYPLQILRLALSRAAGERISWIWAAAMVAGKFAEARGALDYYIGRLTKRRSGLIEYK
ncbi:MAG: glycosyltransferase family A protein [Pseudomonadota bacterium]